MNHKKKFFAVVVFVSVVALLGAGAARADRLEMKDGRVIEGTYMGGSRVNVHFRVDGTTKIYKRTDVSAILLYEEGEAPPKAATAATGTPATTSSGGTAKSATTTTTSGGTVPAGTRIAVRMIDGVDSDTKKAGDTFRASLEEDLTVDGNIVAPKGADVTGKLTEVKEAGRMTGRSELKLELTEIIVNGQTYPLTTGEYELAGASRGKDTAVKVGAGAAIGAVVGAIAGGGKGAAIGAGVGAGAGTAIQVLTRGEQVKVPSETMLEFTLEQDLVVPRPSSTRRRR
jgi:hypothetical protein